MRLKPTKQPAQSSGRGPFKKGVFLVTLVVVAMMESFRMVLPLASHNPYNLVTDTTRDLQGNHSVRFVETQLINKSSDHVVEATSDASASKSTESQPTSTNLTKPDSIHEPLKSSESEKAIAKDLNRDIVFVHVGKAGGRSIRPNVAAGCIDQRKMNQTACFATFPKKEPLANQTRSLIHMWALRPEAVTNATSFLVNLRDPIDRIVSAYRYTHPVNCRPGNSTNYACYMEKAGRFKPKGKPHYLFKNCFPSAAMEDMAQAVLSPDNSNQHFLQKGFTPEQQCKCRKFARLTLQGDRKHAYVSPHMLYNYKYYGDASYNKYPDKEVFALRTDHEYEDMVALDKSLGGSGRFRRPNNHFTHGSENYLPSPLTDEAYQKLCCVLESEINQYFDIFSRALNMNQEHLLEAESSLRTKCGLAPKQSWDDWRTKCRAKLAEPMGC